MQEDGFLLLRGLIERQKVLKASETVLRYMEEHKALTADTPLLEGVMPQGGHWLTANFYAGDVMIFGMHGMHASTTNLTNRFRLSCDICFQPASEPADPRWVGESSGHNNPKKPKPIEVARAEWGV